MAAKIEDYALIGDCETAALVDKNGSIDWLCWPDFSSAACFASLLGSEENGYWKISPAEGKGKTTRRYRPHTLILETTFEHKSGSFRLIDFMPVRQRNSHIVRIVEGIRGKVPVRMEMALRFDYGLTVPWVTHVPGGVRAIAGPNLAVLRASVPLSGENMRTVADFTVSKGDRVGFSLSYGLSYKRNPAKIDLARTLRQAEQSWRRWSARLNLTSARTEDAIISRHLAESIACAMALPPGPRVFDRLCGPAHGGEKCAHVCRTGAQPARPGHASRPAGRKRCYGARCR